MREEITCSYSARVPVPEIVIGLNYTDDDTVIAHELIHLHETILEEYLPDYYTDSDVCTLNILYKYLDKEELSSEDEEYILESFKSKEEIIEEVERIEVDLFQEAVKEYYKQQYLN